MSGSPAAGTPTTLQNTGCFSQWGVLQPKSMFIYHSENQHRIHAYSCRREGELQLWAPPVKLHIKLCGLVDWLWAQI